MKRGCKFYNPIVDSENPDNHIEVCMLYPSMMNECTDCVLTTEQTFSIISVLKGVTQWQKQNQNQPLIMPIMAKEPDLKLFHGQK